MYTDLPAFLSAEAPITEVDFENLFSLISQGVTFRNPLPLHTGFCSSSSCPPDPDNPYGGNVVLFLDPGATIDFTDPKQIATLIVEPGATTFSLQVTPVEGDPFNIPGPPTPSPGSSLVVSAPSGIARISVAEATGGPVVISAVETGLLVPRVIDFEDVPPSASCVLSVCTPSLPSEPPRIPNPLTLEGVTFTSPYSIDAGFCSAPTCLPDLDNPLGNIALGLPINTTIDLPTRTGSVMIVVEGMGDNPFAVRALDSAGAELRVESRGVLFGVAYLGVAAAEGIARLEVTSVGGTGGGLVLSAILLGGSSIGPADPWILALGLAAVAVVVSAGVVIIFRGWSPRAPKT